LDALSRTVQLDDGIASRDGHALFVIVRRDRDDTAERSTDQGDTLGCGALAPPSSAVTAALAAVVTTAPAARGVPSGGGVAPLAKNLATSRGKMRATSSRSM
jgi:hypothetical protein